MVKIIGLISLLLIAVNCDTTAPPTNDIQPGRRDYVWTVDTLTVPPGYLFYLWNFWGADTSNIWLAGQGDKPYNLWRYNGIEWEPFPQSIYGSFGAIFGFSASNIWIAGTATIQHYNGTIWEKANNTDYPNSYLTSFNDLWGSNYNDVFAVGGVVEDISGSQYFGAIIHFNGSYWEFVDMPKERVGFSLIRQASKESNHYYLSGTRFESVEDTNKIFEFDGSNLRTIWSGTEVSSVNEIGGRIYLAIGKKIYKYQNDVLNIWKDFSGTTYVGRVWGRGEKDFFGVASDGLVHYNGTDLITIYPTHLFINDLLVIENDIYMLCENRIIVHGQL